MIHFLYNNSTEEEHSDGGQSTFSKSGKIKTKGMTRIAESELKAVSSNQPSNFHTKNPDLH